MPIFDKDLDPNGYNSEKEAFGRPDGSRTLLWFYYCKPREYYPLLVKVDRIDRGRIYFWILKISDGQLAHPNPIDEPLHDPDRCHDVLPSTLEGLDPTSEARRYIFLMVSEDVLDRVKNDLGLERSVITAGKWPHGSGAPSKPLASGLRKLLDERSAKGKVLDADEESAIERLLSLL